MSDATAVELVIENCDSRRLFSLCDLELDASLFELRWQPREPFPIDIEPTRRAVVAVVEIVATSSAAEMEASSELRLWFNWHGGDASTPLRICTSKHTVRWTPPPLPSDHHSHQTNRRIFCFDKPRAIGLDTATLVEPPHKSTSLPAPTPAATASPLDQPQRRPPPTPDVDDVPVPTAQLETIEVGLDAPTLSEQRQLAVQPDLQRPPPAAADTCGENNGEKTNGRRGCDECYNGGDDDEGK